MAVLQTIRLVITYLIGLFWLSLVSLQVIRLAVTKRGKFFGKKNRTVPPKCMEDPALGVHYTVQLKSSGTKLHYVESGPKDGQVMLMIHGFPEFWYSWRHQIREYSQKYRVIAVDTRGYGGSSKPSAVAEYTVAKLRDDMKDLLETIGSKKKSIVLGHDWGGAITWSLAAHCPHLVEKVVIMNCPHPGAMMKYMQKSWTQFLKSWYMFLVNLPYFPEWFFQTGDLHMLENALRGRTMGAQKGAISDQDMEAFKYSFNNRRDFIGPMNYIRAAVRGLNRGRDLGTVKEVPILLVWGTRDGALNMQMAELSRSFASDLQIIPVEGASHWVQQDEPKIVNKHVTEFLRKK